MDKPANAPAVTKNALATNSPVKQEEWTIGIAPSTQRKDKIHF